MNNLYNVMTKQNKGRLVNFRVRDDFKREFEIVAELRGTTMSGLIHQLLVKAVREEKEREPRAFDRLKDDRNNTEYLGRAVVDRSIIAGFKTYDTEEESKAAWYREEEECNRLKNGGKGDDGCGDIKKTG